MLRAHASARPTSSESLASEAQRGVGVIHGLHWSNTHTHREITHRHKTHTKHTRARANAHTDTGAYVPGVCSASVAVGSLFATSPRSGAGHCCSRLAVELCAAHRPCACAASPCASAWKGALSSSLGAVVQGWITACLRPACGLLWALGIGSRSRAARGQRVAADMTRAESQSTEQRALQMRGVVRARCARVCFEGVDPRFICAADCDCWGASRREREREPGPSVMLLLWLGPSLGNDVESPSPGPENH